jgi:cyanophycinase-like exopeptidase
MFGYSPKHVSVHRDNYKRTTDLGNSEGQKNFEMLKNADVIFFDGGDQIRHSLCWLTEEGKPNSMFQMILDRAIADKVILGGTSAGTMIWSNPAYGGGSSLGYLYFYESVGLAQKKISDGAIGGTGLHDVRNGTSSLQYY